MVVPLALRERGGCFQLDRSGTEALRLAKNTIPDLKGKVFQNPKRHGLQAPHVKTVTK